jgi:hypothetical protein
MIKSLSVGSLLAVKKSKKKKRLWHEARLEAKMHKAFQFRNTFRRGDVEKMRAVEASCFV